jgi:hypothetical protein
MPPTKFHKKQAVKAGKRYGIPPKVLLGLMEQESGFNAGAVSSAAAQGLTQFIPSTAKAYGVQYGTSKKAQKTQIQGAAKYLKDLGFRSNKKNALGRYYGSTSAPYASEVLAKSKKYKGVQKQYSKGGGPSGGKRGAQTKGYKLAQTKGKKLSVPFVKQAAESRETERKQAALSFIQQDDKTAADYAAFKSTMESLKDVPADIGFDKLQLPGRTKVKQTKGQSAKGGKGGAKKASGPANIVRIGKMAQKMGLNVGENPKFGGVAPVHTEGSYHYSGRAIDVSGDPNKMKKFARRVDKKYGPKLAELFWNGAGARNRDNGKKVGKGYVSGHTEHVHVAVPR